MKHSRTERSLQYIKNVSKINTALLQSKRITMTYRPCKTMERLVPKPKTSKTEVKYSVYKVKGLI